jgi:outer membrane protein
MGKPLSIALGLALACLAAGTAHSQSLVELYQAAKAYDANYLATLSALESARFKAAQSEALLRPSATLSSGMGGTPTLSIAEVPSAGGRSSGNTVNVDATLSGRYSLINRAAAPTIEQAQRAVELSQADVEAAEQDLIIRLSQAYFNVLAAKDTLTTAQASKAAITEQLASAKRNFEVGTATITDTREAQARFDLAVASELAADNDLRTKRIALDQLVGRTGVQPLALALPVNLPAVQPADSEIWVETADKSHPSIRKARLDLEVARLEIDKAKAAKEPTLDAIARVVASNTSGSLPQFTGNSVQGAVGLQFNWALFNGGSTDNRIRETLAMEAKSLHSVEAARRGVSQATRQAFFGVQSGRAQVSALEAAESSSKLALEATQLGYKVGVRVNLDVLNAQTQLYQTQQNLAKARYDVILGDLRLRQASGQLKAGDLEGVNGLLAK